MTTNLSKISLDLISSFKEKFREKFKDVIKADLIILGTVKGGVEVKYGLQADKIETIVSLALVELMDSILKIVEEAKTPAAPMADMRNIKDMIHKEVENAMARRDPEGRCTITDKEMNEELFRKRRDLCR